MTDKQKILFVQKIDEDEFEVESLWTTKSGEYYIVDNIPFIAKRISLGDTIKAEYDSNENAYYFEDFVAVSGNTTVRIYFNDEDIIADTRKYLASLNAETEAFLSRKIVAVNIPKEVDYIPVKNYLDAGEKDNKWQYEESCLAHEY